MPKFQIFQRQEGSLHISVIFLKKTKKKQSDWLIVYRLSLCSNISHVKGRRNVAGEGLQQFGLSSALMAGAFETGVITAMTQDIGLQDHPL